MSVKNVDESTASALEALRQFELAVRRSGFPQGLDAYQRMADVLIGQKLWTRSNGCDRFDDRFDELGRLAAGIYEILAPYAETMRKLAVLGALGADDSAEPVPGSLPGRLLTEIRKRRRPASVNALRAQLGESTKDTRAAAERLAAAGLVEIVGNGGRRRYQAKARQ